VKERELPRVKRQKKRAERGPVEERKKTKLRSPPRKERDIDQGSNFRSEKTRKGPLRCKEEGEGQRGEGTW